MSPAHNMSAPPNRKSCRCKSVHTRSRGSVSWKLVMDISFFWCLQNQIQRRRHHTHPVLILLFTYFIDLNTFVICSMHLHIQTQSSRMEAQTGAELCLNVQHVHCCVTARLVFFLFPLHLTLTGLHKNIF